MPSEIPARFGFSTRHLPAFLLGTNVVYFFALPTFTDQAASAFGILVGLILVIGPRVSKRFATALYAEFPRSVRVPPLLVLVLLLLPAVSLFWEPSVAFWTIDGRALIVVAWLCTLSWLIARVRPAGWTTDASGRRFASPVFLLFITWSALFWLMLVWDVGVGRVVFAKDLPDRLTISFELWQTQSPRDHLFLIWLTRDDFLRHEVYTNHLHPYLFFIYGCTKLVQLATGLPLYVGRNLTPVAIAAVGVLSAAVVLTRTRIVSTVVGLKFYVSLFLLLGFLVSTWEYWMALYVTNVDNVFPLIAYLNAIVWASAQPRISKRNAAAVIASAVLFAAFGWVYTPLVILALWCYFGRLSHTVTGKVARNQTLVTASVAAGVVAILTYTLPLLLVAMKGYTTSGSPYIFRAGLDGDVRYFHDLAQAVFQPHWDDARTPWTLVFPAFVPFVACLVWGSRLVRYRTLSQFGFLAAPYFFSVAVFPQSVSIHPYLYDQLLVLPAVLAGVTNCLDPALQRRIRGPCALGALLLMAILIMSNYIAIAQAMQTALAQ